MNASILVTRRIPTQGIEILKKYFTNVDVNPEDRPMSRKEILDQVSGRDGVLCLLTDTIDEEVLDAACGVKIFANYAVGYNNIDVEAATQRKIMVTNTPGVLTNATADLTWSLLFAVARRIVESDRFTREGKFRGWGPMLFLGCELSGKTLGIIGAGRIGTAVALRSAGFGMKVIYVDKKRNKEIEERVGAISVDMDFLLSRSDFVSIHVPLSPETHHLISHRELGLMKKSSYLINTSRGPVIDEEALVVALQRGTIAGAGLDVYENEPDIEPDLKRLNNVVLLPHIGSATHEARTKMAVMAAENIVAGLKGERPPNLINPEVLER